MFNNMTEIQARKYILEIVKKYYRTYHNKRKNFEQGDNIAYASRVYDYEEICNFHMKLQSFLDRGTKCP